MLDLFDKKIARKKVRLLAQWFILVTWWSITIPLALAILHGGMGILVGLPGFEMAAEFLSKAAPPISQTAVLLYVIGLVGLFACFGCGIQLAWQLYRRHSVFTWVLTEASQTWIAKIVSVPSRIHGIASTYCLNLSLRVPVHRPRGSGLYRAPSLAGATPALE